MIKFFASMFIVISIEAIIEVLMGWKSTIWIDFISAVLFLNIVKPGEVMKSIREGKK
jgi:hypothetical protein